MFKKGSKIYSIVKFKCPKCHIGELYPTKVWTFKGWFNMNEKCNNCGQKFVLEPGFFWGAMYIGYIVSSFLIFTFFAIFFFGMDITVGYAFLLSLVVIIFLYAYIFRISRAIWINIYIRYKPDLLN